MSAAPLSDPDWLNPILVRCFRSTFKSRVFTWGFLLFLLVLLAFVISVVAAAKVGRGAAESSAAFIHVIMLAPLIVLPGLSFAVFKNEKAENTLELLLVTGLELKRIAWGAWFTFVSISLLWQLVLMPVWILFYFTHGENILQSLSTVLIYVCLAGVSTMLWLWLGLLGTRFVRFFSLLLWGIAYLFTLGFGSSIAVDAANTPGAFFYFLLHSFLVVLITEKLVENELMSVTHPSYVDFRLYDS